ncbi:MAG: S41 family peptidase [Bacteroides sp.]|nr:S41 family peptidase [Bacteroides sp.]
MSKKMKIRFLLIGAVLVSGVTFLSFRGDNRNFQIAKNLDIFNAIVKELDLFYVDTIDPNKTVREGIDYMLMQLDPYTNYFPEEEQSDLEQLTRGSYGGIGSMIRYHSKLKRVVIVEPYEGMPAAEAGLKAGDILWEIDGEDLNGLTSDKVSSMLRGPEGSNFKLKVKRPGTESLLEFTMVRKSIQLPTVPYYTVMDGDVGYINLNSFSGTPSKAFKAAFLELKKQGINSLVIDLRNNGGGLMDEVVEIANFFVPKGKVIVSTRGKMKQADHVYRTTKQPLDTEIPLTVLINSNSASASEVLAGALQDLDRAVIVGERSLGKGLVQTPRSLPYGAAIKITTSKYYTPSGRCVQAIDYSNRNPEGRAVRVPDSLTTVFKTSVGREVRDGGGITPDVSVDQDKFPNILFYLSNDDLIFDYATEYVQAHPVIAPAASFEISDADYEAFKEKVKASDFKYDQQSEKILKTLREAAEFEGYLENASEEFTALEKKLNHNLDRDLDHFSNYIRKMINIEIAKRYYFQTGGIIEQLKDDDYLEEAIRILKDPARYRELLAPGQEIGAEDKE